MQKHNSLQELEKKATPSVPKYKNVFDTSLKTGFLRGLGGRRGIRTTGWRIEGLGLASKKRSGEGDQVGRAERVGARHEGTSCTLFFPFSGVSPDSFPLFPKTAGVLDLANERPGAP